MFSRRNGYIGIRLFGLSILLRLNGYELKEFWEQRPKRKLKWQKKQL